MMDRSILSDSEGASWRTKTIRAECGSGSGVKGDQATVRSRGCSMGFRSTVDNDIGRSWYQKSWYISFEVAGIRSLEGRQSRAAEIFRPKECLNIAAFTNL